MPMNYERRRPVVIVDVETTGLDPEKHEAWELAAIRLDTDGQIEQAVSMFLPHNWESRDLNLPVNFVIDHDTRFDEGKVWRAKGRGEALHQLFRGRPTFVGAVPSFDAPFVSRLFGGSTPWSHQLRCVEAMTVGYLGYDPGGLSSCLSALGLPEIEHPHRAMDDALGALRIWQHLTQREL